MAQMINPIFQNILAAHLNEKGQGHTLGRHKSVRAQGKPAVGEIILGICWQRTVAEGLPSRPKTLTKGGNYNDR